MSRRQAVGTFSDHTNVVFIDWVVETIFAWPSEEVATVPIVMISLRESALKYFKYIQNLSANGIINEPKTPLLPYTVKFYEYLCIMVFEKGTQKSLALIIFK